MGIVRLIPISTQYPVNALLRSETAAQSDLLFFLAFALAHLAVTAFRASSRLSSGVLPFGTVMCRAIVFEPARKTPALGGRPWEPVRMRSWLLWLCSSTLPPLLAASHPLRFHPPRHVLGTTHKRAGGFALRFWHRCAPDTCTFATCQCVRRK